MDIRSITNSQQSAVVFADKGPPDVSSIPVKAATPVETTAAVQQPVPIPSLEQVTQAVKSINQTLRILSPDLEFSVDADTDRTIIKVVDQQTKEVIRQMPTQEALDIAKALDKMQGLLLKQKA